MIFEQDGSHPSKQWGDIQNTFYNAGDQLALGELYQNHARVFVSKWHHSMHDDRYTQFKNTCPPNSVSDFRTDDYYYWSAGNLQPMDSIPSKSRSFYNRIYEANDIQRAGILAPLPLPVARAFVTSNY